MQSIADSIADAWKRRQSLHDDPAIDCYRVFHGYSEGQRGLSIDRYGSLAVVNQKTTELDEDEILESLLEHFPFERIIIKTDQRLPCVGQERVRLLHGAELDSEAIVSESGLRFMADAASLHTNGLYLDARSARTWIKENSMGRRVLNVFAHTGSLGLCASAGGAKGVMHLDKSRRVLEKIRDNYRLNGMQIDDRSLVCGDLYFHLPRAVRSGKRFDAIILDPPPKVPPPPRAPKHRPQGQDFKHLIGICSQLLNPGGWLLCLYHNHALTHDEHDALVEAASSLELRRLWQGESGEDFPELTRDQKTRYSAFEAIPAHQLSAGTET